MRQNLTTRQYLDSFPLLEKEAEESFDKDAVICVVAGKDTRGRQ